MPAQRSFVDSPDGWSAAGGFRLELLGGFRLRRGERELELPAGGQRLVAYLALRGPQTRSTVAGELRPDVAEASAQGSLRTTLWRVQRVAPVVQARGGQLGLHPSVTADTGQLDRWIAGRAPADGAGPERTPVPLVALRAGDLLPAWDEHWVGLERERLRQVRLHALDAAARQLAAGGRYAEALDLALEAVRAEPLRESAHRTVIAIHLAEHNVGEALRQYRTLSHVLHTDLGAIPSEQLTTLLAERLSRSAVAVR